MTISARGPLAAFATALAVVAFSVTAALAAPASSRSVAASRSSSAPGLKKVHDPGRVTGTIHGHCAYRDQG